MLFEEVFSKLKVNCDLLLFENGPKALNQLEKSDFRVPHIIFLDLNMPIVDGLEIVEMLRRTSKYRDVPIAIYSTSSSDKDMQDTLIRGANIYIVKPNDYNRLKEVLENVMRMQWQYNSSSLRMDTFVKVYK